MICLLLGTLRSRCRGGPIVEDSKSRSCNRSSATTCRDSLEVGRPVPSITTTGARVRGGSLLAPVSMILADAVMAALLSEGAAGLGVLIL